MVLKTRSATRSPDASDIANRKSKRKLQRSPQEDSQGAKTGNLDHLFAFLAPFCGSSGVLQMPPEIRNPKRIQKSKARMLQVREQSAGSEPELLNNTSRHVNL